MTTLRFFVVLATVTLAACGGGGKSYGSTCSSASDCQSGFICPTDGPMAGKCTISCTKDEQCTSIGGGVCTSDVCDPAPH